MYPKQKKNSCSTYYSFNVLFSIITYNFLPTVQLLASYNWCLPSLLAFTYSYTLHLQSYRIQVKKIFRNFKNSVRVGLAVLKKIIIFLKF